MNKQEFKSKLSKKLSDLPPCDVQERIGFYMEMIDDRIEEGASEKNAVLEIGSIDEIASQIRAEISNIDTPTKSSERRKLKAWEMVLLILASPIWFSLLLAASIIIFVLFIVMWALVIVLWTIELPFIICEYISKFLFWSCKKSTKGAAHLTKGFGAFTKKVFTFKGDK